MLPAREMLTGFDFPAVTVIADPLSMAPNRETRSTLGMVAAIDFSVFAVIVRVLEN